MARWLALTFLLCGLVTGLGCALLTPIGMFPDEFAHCARADGLLYRQIYGQKPPPGHAPYVVNEGVLADPGILTLFFAREYNDAVPDRPVPAADRLAVEQEPWFYGKVYFPTQMVAYFPVMYLPAAAGLQGGKILRLTPLHVFYAGRLAMVFAFLLLGTAAVGLARRGNGLIFAVLTLPTTINLASSYNEDGLIIACCALAAALLTRRAGPAWSRSWSWSCAVALLSAVACAKTPYAALLLLCLPPLLAPQLGRRLGWMVLACVPPGLWLLHMIYAGFMAYPRPAYHPGPLWPGARDVLLQTVQPSYNIQVFWAHPAQIFLLPLSSFALHWGHDWRFLLGMISTDSVLIYPWEYPCLALALLCAWCGALATGPAGRGVDAVWAALVLFAAFCGMELSMYLTFTRAGLGWIEGVQPRYLLPLLPFLLFLRAGTRNWVPHPGWLTLPAVAMAVINTYALPAYIFHLFRMPGP